MNGENSQNISSRLFKFFNNFENVYISNYFDMKGRVLKVSVVPLDSFFELDEDGETIQPIGGVEYQFLEILSKSMNFR